MRQKVRYKLINFTEKSVKEYDDNEYIDSPQFEVSFEGEKSLWSLRLFPNHYKRLAFYAICSDIHCSNTYLDFLVYILRKNGEQRCTKVSLKQKVEGNEKNEFKFGWDKLITHEKMFTKDEGLIIDDSITFIVELQLFKYSEYDCNMNEHSSIIRDFEKLLSTDHFKDFTIICNDEVRIKVNKCILSVRSEFFNEEIKLLTKKRKNHMNVPISSQIMNSILKFIHCGYVETFSTELYLAAKKLRLVELQKLCIERISLELMNDTEESMEILKFAETQNEIELKKLCIDVIKWRFNEIRDPEEWKNVSDSLKQEIIVSLADAPLLLTFLSSL